MKLPVIRMNDFVAEPDSLKDQMAEAARRVIVSGRYVLGAEGAEFERAWSSVCGLAHGVGTGNGMDAIELALRAQGIGEGDEVITTPMTAFATVLAVIRSGASPVLADIEPETGLLSIESVARCLTSRTKAVLLVHLYGQLRGMARWLAFCQQHQLHLIEDCAQAHLATWRGRFAGSFGVAGAYSFYPTKNLGALGDAGMLVTSGPEIARCAASLRNYGLSEAYAHPILGMNSRLDEMQAAILMARLPWLKAFTERRRQIAQAYRLGIQNPGVDLLLEPEEPSAHVYHLFVIGCDQRDRLRQHMAERGVDCAIHYPIPVHHQATCKSLARDPQGLAASERHASRCLTLPCHPQMSDNDVSRIVDAVNSFVG